MTDSLPTLDTVAAHLNHRLTPFEGRDVVKATIAVTNAGDGLSNAMKVEPREMHHGERAYVVLECDVADVRMVPLDKGDPLGALVRVHTLRAGAATIVDEDLVAEHVKAQKARILKAQEEAAGIMRIPGTDTDADDAQALADKEERLAAAEAEAEGRPAGDDEWDDVPTPEPTPIGDAVKKATPRKRAPRKSSK